MRLRLLDDTGQTVTGSHPGAKTLEKTFEQNRKSPIYFVSLCRKYLLLSTVCCEINHFNLSFNARLWSLS